MQGCPSGQEENRLSECCLVTVVWSIVLKMGNDRATVPKEANSCLLEGCLPRRLSLWQGYSPHPWWEAGLTGPPGSMGVGSGCPHAQPPPPVAGQCCPLPAPQSPGRWPWAAGCLLPPPESCVAHVLGGLKTPAQPPTHFFWYMAFLSILYCGSGVCSDILILWARLETIWGSLG